MKEKFQKLTEMNFAEVAALVKENRKTAEKALLGIIVVIVLAIFLLGGRGEEEISFAGAEGGAAESGLISGGSAVSGENAQSEDGEAAFGEGKIYVYVAGAVEKPGVVILNEGDRIFHAIDAAGGFSKDAAGERLNLAQIVEDGDKLYVPTFEELEAAENGEGDGFIAEAAGLESSNGKININTASSSELQSISGIGAVTAGKIVSYREANGKFKTIEDIKNVSGIGNATFEKMKDEICVR